MTKKEFGHQESKKVDNHGDQDDADLGEEGEVEGEEGEVEEAGQDGQHGHLQSKYLVMIVQSYDVVIMR